MLFVSVPGNMDFPTCREEFFCTDDSTLPLSLSRTKSLSEMIRKTKQQKLDAFVIFLSLKLGQSPWKLLR